MKGRGNLNPFTLTPPSPIEGEGVLIKAEISNGSYE
jgi:hypothetical protein